MRFAYGHSGKVLILQQGYLLDDAFRLDIVFVEGVDVDGWAGCFHTANLSNDINVQIVFKLENSLKRCRGFPCRSCTRPGR